MGGPNVVRGGSHSGNVAAADLARHGLLDILSSDYVPGSLLSAVLRLVADDILSLPEAVAIVSRNPARATGLDDRGAIEPGLRADLVQVRVVNMPNGLRHGVVRAVWREGMRVSYFRPACGVTPRGRRLRPGNRFRGALGLTPLRREVTSPRMRWNRLCRATRIAPLGGDAVGGAGGGSDAARGVSFNLLPTVKRLSQ
jgi:hypothetical protein